MNRRPVESAENDRAVAETIEFNLAIVLMVLAVGAFTVGLEFALTSTGGTDDTASAVGLRAADHASGDLLVTTPDADTLNRSCVESFFSKQDAGCYSINSANTGGTDSSFLEATLGVSSVYNLNVTIKKPSEEFGQSSCSVNGVICTIGEEVPESSEAAILHRRVAMEDNTGNIEYWTLYVVVWR